MKRLLELRQQKTDLTAQMRSMLTLAETEKRTLTEDEAKNFDALRHQSETLNTEIARYESLADEERTLAAKPVQKEQGNEALRHYILQGKRAGFRLGFRLMVATPLSLN